MPRKSKKVATPSLTAEEQIEAEITAIEGTLPRITVEVAASEIVTPGEPVNEGPVAPADIPPADTDDESAYEAGEFVIPDGRALAHAIASATDDTFTAVCGRSYALAGATMPGALSDRCAFCEDGETAPADTDDEPATLKPRANARTNAPAVSVTDAEHVSQFGAMLTDLVAYVTAHGNGADARAFYGHLTRAVDAVKPLTKLDRTPRVTATGEGSRTYVRVMPTGRVSVTLKLPGESEPVSVASMGDACRKLAACMPSAEKCAAYVKRVDELKMTANARVFIQADIDAGRIPADVVSFGTK